MEYDIDSPVPVPLTSQSDRFEPATSAHQWQRQHTFALTYAIRNGGPTNLATGSRGSAIRIRAGGNIEYPDSVFSENNYIFPGAILQPETSNAIDSLDPTYATAAETGTISGTGSHGPPNHSFPYNHERTIKIVCPLRPAILQALIDAYPTGTITFLVGVVSDQGLNYDIHSGTLYKRFIGDTAWTMPEATFPLTDFGVTPTPATEENCTYTEDPAPVCSYTEDAAAVCTYSEDAATVCTYTND